MENFLRKNEKGVGPNSGCIRAFMKSFYKARKSHIDINVHFSDASQTTTKWTQSERRCSLSKVRPTPCMLPSPDSKELSKNPTPRMMSMNVLLEIWAKRSKLMRLSLTKPTIN